MVLCGAMPPERGDVRPGAISFMALETELRVTLAEPLHIPVSGHFRRDGGKRDRLNTLIPFYERAGRAFYAAIGHQAFGKTNTRIKNDGCRSDPGRVLCREPSDDRSGSAVYGTGDVFPVNDARRNP